MAYLKPWRHVIDQWLGRAFIRLSSDYRSCYKNFFIESIWQKCRQLSIFHNTLRIRKLRICSYGVEKSFMEQAPVVQICSWILTLTTLTPRTVRIRYYLHIVFACPICRVFVEFLPKSGLILEVRFNFVIEFQWRSQL